MHSGPNVLTSAGRMPQSSSDRAADTTVVNHGSERASVLLVEADSPERQRLGEALEAGGFEVVECPGPTEPDDDCVGLRTGLCPLLTDVDVVVLDVQLEANDVEFRTTSEELLNLYLEAVGRWSRWGSVAAGWTRRLLRLQALAGRRRVGSRRPSARRTRCGERAE